MGDRGEVEIVDTDGTLYLYTHYDATELPAIVQQALIRGKEFIDDPSYLTRIIFCEMIKDDVLGTTGNGISVSHAGDAWRIVKVIPGGVCNLESGLVEITDNGTTWLSMDIESFMALPEVPAGPACGEERS